MEEILNFRVSAVKDRSILVRLISLVGVLETVRMVRGQVVMEVKCAKV